MRVVICGSMQYTEQQIEIRDNLIKMGHEAWVTTFAEPMVGKSDEEKEKMKIHQKKI